MRKKQICPQCGSKDTAEIIYGLPIFSDELERKIENKKIVLGGCCITDDDPTHLCNSCENKFTSRQQK